MSYRYEDYKDYTFNDEGQRKLLKIRDRAHELFADGQPHRMEELIQGAGGISWESMACVDRLVELGELREKQMPLDTFGQRRTFVSVGNRVKTVNK